MQTLPKSMPCVLADGYSVETKGNVLRSQMQSGRIRQRRTSRKTQRTANVSWILNDDQYKYFDTFVQEKLNGGADWFLAKIATGGGVLTHQVRIINGEFTASYLTGGKWKISAIIDIFEAAVELTEELYRLLSENGGEFLLSLYEIVHVEMPEIEL